MATLTHNHSFGSEQKLKNGDRNSKGYSSAIGRHSRDLEGNANKGTAISTSQFDPQKDRSGHLHGKESLFKQRVDQQMEQAATRQQTSTARAYPHPTIQQSAPSECQYEQKILKDLSSSVKSFIKRNQQMRVHSHTEDLQLLKKENKELQSTIDQFRIKASTHEILLNEENKYLHEYLNTKNSQVHESYLPKKKQANMDESQGEVGIANLKKYFMTYINTVIESNDEKMESQRRKISKLEQRVAELSKIESSVEHWRFQKAVKLQESGRKSKNFSVGAIKNTGDRVQYDVQMPIEGQIKQQPKTFRNPYKTEKPLENEQDILSKIAQLEQQLSNFRQKYEIELESHMSDLSDRDQLLSHVDRFTKENSDLKRQVFSLEERLKYAQEKESGLESYILNQKLRYSGKIEPNVGFSFKKELLEVKADLKACRLQKFQVVQKEIISLLIDRDYLRKELSELQRSLTQESKFSSTHRQVFLLKEKNNELRQTCEFYSHIVAEYEREHELPLPQGAASKGKESQRRVGQISWGDRSECLKWPRAIHHCLLSSIKRLQNLENQMRKIPDS